AVVQYQRHDLQYAADRQLHLEGHHPEAGRHHLHRHARGRDPGQAGGRAGLAQAGRQGRLQPRAAPRAQVRANMSPERGGPMRKLLLAVALVLSTPAFAEKDPSGTADEAKAMLTKTIAAIKADKAKTLAAINKGEGGFLDRDLYPFCFNLSDGTNVAVAPARQNLIGKDVRLNKDSTGKAFGQMIYDAAKNGKEGALAEISYLFPKPGADATPVPKVSFVTRVGDLGCGVGYYKK